MLPAAIIILNSGSVEKLLDFATECMQDGFVAAGVDLLYDIIERWRR
jgi:hypothetical protein